MSASWKTITLADATNGSQADWEVASGGSLGMTVPSSWTTPSTPEKADNQQPATFSVQINVPSATDPEGSIFEIGGNPRGPYLGFDGSHDLIWRFSTGGTGRRVVVPLANIPRDQTITIIAQLNFLGINASSFLSETPVRVPLQARVWVNLKGYSSGFLSADQHEGLTNWSNISTGKVNGKSGAIVRRESGNYDQAVTISGVTFVTGLRYWHNTIVEQPAKDIAIRQVLQESSKDRRSYQLDMKDFRVTWINSQNLRIDYANSTFKTQVVWDHNRISDVKYEDHEVHQVTQLNSRTLRSL